MHFDIHMWKGKARNVYSRFSHGTDTEIIEPRNDIYNNVACATSEGSGQPAHMRSLIKAFASCMNILSVKLTSFEVSKF